MTSSLVFFGAGTSHPFKIPTMIKMVEDFENEIRTSNDEFSLYKKVKSILLKEFPLSKIDIESIFSVIDGIVNTDKPTELGYFAYYYVKSISSTNPISTQDKKTAKKLKESLEKFIEKKCVTPLTEDEILKQLEKSYEIFFNNLFHTATQQNSLGMTYQGGWKAYTTNYDLIFETYWKQFCPIDDFFDSQDSGYAYFNPNKLVQDNQSLIKLHGSLNWWKLDNNLILKSETRPVISNKKALAVLYPIQQKDIVSSPWLTLLQQFKKDLQSRSIWYVVGYGFNDDSIRSIFLESFDSTKKLFLINPKANEIMKDKFPEHLHDQISILPIRFGEGDFGNNFVDFRREKRLIQIKIETTAKMFLIELPRKSRLTKTISSKNIHQNPTNITSGGQSVTLGWQDSNEVEKEVQFEVEIPLKASTKFVEMNVGMNSNTPFKLSVYLRDRLIETVYKTNLTGESSWGPGELVKIPFQKFFNV